MDITVRKWVLFKEEVLNEMGKDDGQGPLIKVASVAVIKNPFAGSYVEDLSMLIEASKTVGDELARRAVASVPEGRIQSYGKASIVGLSGDLEHAVALLTTAFGDILREHVGGGKAWISSVTKRGAPGIAIDVPLAHKDALYVRSHYDAITVVVPDAPLPDELMMIAAVANRGRINARLGGLSVSEIKGEDGLR